MNKREGNIGYTDLSNIADGITKCPSNNKYVTQKRFHPTCKKIQ